MNDKNIHNIKIPYGYIYKITNKLTGEIYIGQHKLSNEPWRKYLGSGKHLITDILLLGEENFVKSLECYVYEKSEMSPTELKIMNKYKEQNYRMYNRNFGSPAFPFNDTYNHMDNIRKKEIFNRRSIKDKNKNQRIFDEKIALIGAQNIIDYYNKIGHMQKTREHFNIKEKNKFREFLINNGVEINSQNTSGKPRNEKTKRAIQEGLIKFNTNKIIMNDEVYSKNMTIKENNEEKEVLVSISKNKLKELYLDKEMSLDEVCAYFKCSKALLNDALLNFNIRKRLPEQNPSHKTKKISREELYDLYVNKDYTIQMLCTHFNCGKSSIYGLLQKYSIPTKASPKLSKLYKESPKK